MEDTGMIPDDFDPNEINQGDKNNVYVSLDTQSNQEEKDESDDDEVKVFNNLVDFGGLATVMKRSQDQQHIQSGRIAKLETLIDRFPTEYVTSESVLDTSERIEYLSKKINQMLDTANRNQKLDTIRLSGTVTNMEIEVGSLDTRMSKMENEYQTLNAKVGHLESLVQEKANMSDFSILSGQVGKAALKADLHEMYVGLTKFALKNDLEDIRELVENSTNKAEAQERENRILEKSNSQITDLKNALLSFASKTQVTRLEEQTIQVLSTASTLGGKVETLESQLERYSEQLDVLDCKIEEKGSMDDIRKLKTSLTSLIVLKDEELKSSQSQLQDQIEALNDNVNFNARGLESYAKEMDTLQLKLAQKISAEDLVHIETELEETYSTKLQLSESVEPLIRKMNQIVSKMIDFDRSISNKADNQLSLENREHIQELYDLVQAKVADAHLPPPIVRKQVTESPSKIDSIVENMQKLQSEVTRINECMSKSNTISVPQSSGHFQRLPSKEATIEEFFKPSNEGIHSVEMHHGNQDREMLNLLEDQRQTKTEVLNLQIAIQEIRNLISRKPLGTALPVVSTTAEGNELLVRGGYSKSPPDVIRVASKPLELPGKGTSSPRTQSLEIK